MASIAAMYACDDGLALPSSAAGVDMPAFGDILSPEEIDAVLAYIKSTRPHPERPCQGGAVARS